MIVKGAWGDSLRVFYASFTRDDAVMRAKKKNAWHCDPSTCEPRSIWSRQWRHSILSFFFDSLKSGYGPISENEIDSKSFNSQVIEALVCLNLLAGNLIC